MACSNCYHCKERDDWKARADALYNLSKEWERRAELAAEQYRRRNAEAHALEAALRHQRAYIEHLMGEKNGIPSHVMKIVGEKYIADIDAAIASQAKEMGPV